MWRITNNIIDQGEKRCPLFTSRNFNEADFASEPKIKFRLLDDDREVYFEGEISAVQLLDGGEDSAFEPLDTVGRSYGCTELQYREKGRWVTL